MLRQCVFCFCFLKEEHYNCEICTHCLADPLVPHAFETVVQYKQCAQCDAVLCPFHVNESRLCAPCEETDDDYEDEGEEGHYYACSCDDEVWEIETNKNVVVMNVVASPPVTDSCSICLEAMRREKVVSLECHSSHMFHERCIVNWFDTDHDSCPLCCARVVGV